jgi:fructose-bisphosphate aldolase, class I
MNASTLHEHELNQEALIATITELAVPGKGILAADESLSTIGKRFATIGLENTEEHRRQYRSLLCTTPDLGDYVNGMILFEETLTQQDDHGKPLPKILAEQGIVPGIKVDKGLIRLANTLDEQVTQGLDGLAERLTHYKEQGARFAKWRNVYRISEVTPSLAAIKIGAENLARYAAICQELGIVPIVEPEVLMDGDHTIEHCAEVIEIVLMELFSALFLHQVHLELMVLKPSMVIAGADCSQQNTAQEVAEYTINVFRNNVPAAIPTINFLSGGQTPEQATTNLNAINSLDIQPWLLSFSYGRALQEPCLQAWQGKADNISAAQDTLYRRAQLNSLASVGEYTGETSSS